MKYAITNVKLRLKDIEDWNAERILRFAKTFEHILLSDEKAFDTFMSVLMNFANALREWSYSDEEYKVLHDLDSIHVYTGKAHKKYIVSIGFVPLRTCFSSDDFSSPVIEAITGRYLDYFNKEEI